MPNKWHTPRGSETAVQQCAQFVHLNAGVCPRRHTRKRALLQAVRAPPKPRPAQQLGHVLRYDIKSLSFPERELAILRRGGRGGGVLGPGGACFQDCAGRLRTRTREHPGKGGWTKACFIFFCSHIFLVQIHILRRNNCGSPSIHKARRRLPSRGRGPPPTIRPSERIFQGFQRYM